MGPSNQLGVIGGMSAKKMNYISSIQQESFFVTRKVIYVVIILFGNVDLYTNDLWK
jgi:hypothetical protein